MKVALAGNWPPPWGGVAVHVAGLARAARARGVDVRVLDVGTGGRTAPGLARARGPVHGPAALAGAAAAGRLVHLHTSGANAKSWLLALAASRARRPGAPRGVLTLHSGSAPGWLAASSARRALARTACAGFGWIVAVSEEIAEALAGCGIDRARVRVLPAFSPQLLEPGVAPPALGPFRARHAPLVAALLSPGPAYGADLLAPAFETLRAAVPGAGLVAFGAGTSEGPGAWHGPGRLGLGELPHPAALAVLAAADIFVRPTRVDGDAVTVREALALGLEVVASDAGHRPPGCRIFPRGDVRALEVALAGAAAAAAATGRARPVAPGGPDPFREIFALWRDLSGPRRAPRTGAVRTGRGCADHAGERAGGRA